MKKIKIFTAILLSCMITACSNAPAVTDAVEKDYASAPHYADLVAWFDRWDYTEEQRESFLKDTETCDWILYDDDYWKETENDYLLTPNGYPATALDIVEQDNRHCKLNACFAVPFGTPTADRAYGHNWKKLKQGDQWNGLTVAAAETFGEKGENNTLYMTYQELKLEGEVTLTGTASYKSSYGEKWEGWIIFILDEECRKELPSLTPYYPAWAVDEDDYTDEGIYFNISDGDEHFREIADRLDAGEKVTLTVTADAFTLKYTEIGLVTDGMTNGIFDNITGLTVEGQKPDTAPNNWYMDGYVVPENWIPLMLCDDAFKHYDELMGEAQEGKTVEEIVETLMNKNTLAFEICHGYGIGTENTGGFSDPCLITYAPFKSIDDLERLVRGTYTSEESDRCLIDNDGKPAPFAAFFEQDGKLYVDFNKMYIWNTDPFNFRTYIEVTDIDDDVCTFVWHYISWEYFDYEYNDTDETYSHHNQMTFHAVKENGEWRLPTIILDNPEINQA